MAFKDFREYLNLLDKDGQLKRVEVPFNVELGTNELQSLMRYLAERDGPALILQNLEGYNTPDIPLIFNPFGTRERTAMTIGCRDPLESKAKHAKILADESVWLDPNLVDRGDAPCKDVVIEKADIALDKQLPHVWFGKEGASYITGGLGITKDPETGERNVGCYRVGQFWKASHPTGVPIPRSVRPSSCWFLHSGTRRRATSVFTWRRRCRWASRLKSRLPANATRRSTWLRLPAYLSGTTNSALRAGCGVLRSTSSNAIR